MTSDRRRRPPREAVASGSGGRDPREAAGPGSGGRDPREAAASGGSTKSRWGSVVRALRSRRSSFRVFAALELLTLGTLARQIILRDDGGLFFCGATCILLYLPFWAQERLGVVLPPTLEIAALCFIFASEILGEVFGFYVSVPGWDGGLHALSGVLTGAVGFSLASLLLGDEELALRLSPLLPALLAFCFSVTVGVLWEFFEFSMDALFHTDMQKDAVVGALYSVALDPERGNRVTALTGISSVVVNGRELGGYLDVGLRDTMKDLLLNVLGALTFSAAGYRLARSRGTQWHAAALLLPRRKAEEQVMRVSAEEGKEHRT